jgi:hypothetical protein
MNQFFKAVGLLSLLFIGLLFYYTLKNFWSRSRKRRSGGLLFSKMYEDEKSYQRNKLKSYLAGMAEGKIRWLLIFSRLFPEDRIQVTYSVPEQGVNLIQHSGT